MCDDEFIFSGIRLYFRSVSTMDKQIDNAVYLKQDGNTAFMQEETDAHSNLAELFVESMRLRK